MGSLSDYLENKLVDHTLGVAAYTPPATIYLALLTADPGDAGPVSEVAYTNYTRQALTFGAAATRQIVQSGELTFPQAGSPATATHWAVMDATSAGNMMAHGALSASKDIVSGNTPKVPNTEVVISWNGGAISDYLANTSLNFAFRNQAFTQPTIHAGLTTAIIGDANTGSSVTEPGDTYARVAVAAWDAAVSGASANTNIIQFATPTGSWGTVVASFLADALSAGNVLFYDNSVTDQAVGADDDVNFPAGNWDVVLA